jgi:hypothetical protein
MSDFGFSDLATGIASFALAKSQNAAGKTPFESGIDNHLRYAKLESTLLEPYQQGVLPVVDLTLKDLQELRQGFATGKISTNAKKNSEWTNDENNIYNIPDGPRIAELFSLIMHGMQTQHKGDALFAKAELHSTFLDMPPSKMRDKLLEKVNLTKHDIEYVGYDRGQWRNRLTSAIASYEQNYINGATSLNNTLRTYAGEFNPNIAITTRVVSLDVTPMDALLAQTPYWNDFSTEMKDQVREAIKSKAIDDKIPGWEKMFNKFTGKEGELAEINKVLGNFSTQLLTKDMSDIRITSRLTTAIHAVAGSYGKTVIECQNTTFAKMNKAMFEKLQTMIVMAYENDTELPVPDKFTYTEKRVNDQRLMIPSFIKAREVLDSTEWWDNENAYWAGKVLNNPTVLNVTKSLNPNSGKEEIAPGFSKEKGYEFTRFLCFRDLQNFDGNRHYVGPSNIHINSIRLAYYLGAETTETWAKTPNILVFDGNTKAVSKGADNEFELVPSVSALENDKIGKKWRLDRMIDDDELSNTMSPINNAFFALPHDVFDRHMKSSGMVNMLGKEVPKINPPKFSEGVLFATIPDPKVDKGELLRRSIIHYNSLTTAAVTIPTEPQAMARKEVFTQGLNGGLGAVFDGKNTAAPDDNSMVGKAVQKAPVIKVVWNATTALVGKTFMLPFRAAGIALFTPGRLVKGWHNTKDPLTNTFKIPDFDGILGQTWGGKAAAIVANIAWIIGAPVAYEKLTAEAHLVTDNAIISNEGKNHEIWTKDTAFSTWTLPERYSESFNKGDKIKINGKFVEADKDAILVYGQGTEVGAVKNPDGGWVIIRAEGADIRVQSKILGGLDEKNWGEITKTLNAKEKAQSASQPTSAIEKIIREKNSKGKTEENLDNMNTPWQNITLRRKDENEQTANISGKS